MKGLMMPRVAPFATFMAFIFFNETVNWLKEKEFVSADPNLTLYLYPVRVITVALILAYFWKEYTEIRFRDLLNLRSTLLSLLVGIVVFILWINMPWTLAASGTPAGYDPTLVSDNFTRYVLIGFRLIGAALVVPIMEELFWRSLVLRYTICPDISQIPIGTFSWGSFLVSNLLFGLEHHLFYAGLMAGIAYCLLLYRTRSIMHCIFAHGVTNLVLGFYVLKSNSWCLW